MATDPGDPQPDSRQPHAKRASAAEEARKLGSPVGGPREAEDVAALASKLKRAALAAPPRLGPAAARPPPCRSSSRFGSLSQRSFFSRHNPHAHRVTHIAGLNSMPVCTVKDGWPALSPLSLHSRIKDRLSTPIPGVPGRQMPIGDPPSKAIPWLTTGALSEAWREELRELAARVNAFPPAGTARKEVASQEKVLELLCQILQTDSLMAIQQWLLTAGQREKDVVLALLQTATATLQLQLQVLTAGTGDSAGCQASQTTAGLSSGDRRGGRNQPGRYSQGQKQEPVPQEDKPVHAGTAEVLQVHSTQEEKPRQPDPTN